MGWEGGGNGLEMGWKWAGNGLVAGDTIWVCLHTYCTGGHGRSSSVASAASNSTSGSNALKANHRSLIKPNGRIFANVLAQLSIACKLPPALAIEIYERVEVHTCARGAVRSRLRAVGRTGA